MNKILIKNTALVAMDQKSRIIPKTDILIEGDRIAKISPNIRPLGKVKVIDGQNQVALPGLVNCHTHAAMTLFRGFADDLPLRVWWEKRLLPAEEKLISSDVYWGSLLGCAEMIAAGITTFNDMYWYEEATAQAAQDSGLRACVSAVIVGFKPDWENDLKEGSQILLKKFPPKKYPRIKIWLGPHAPYSCNEKVLKKIIDIGKKFGLPIHIHASETKDGIGGIEQLEKSGIFSLPTLVAHCVWPKESEIKILKKRRVAIAHCPTANLKLADGIAPAWKMIRAGVEVGLGTDGTASNNSLNILAEAKLAGLLAKATSGNPTALPAYQALEMATIGGARALRLDKEIGSIEIGKQADVILVDFNAPHLQPIHNLVSSLIYSASGADVSTTIVAGKILMANQRLQVLNLPKIYQEIQKIIRKL